MIRKNPNIWLIGQYRSNLPRVRVSLSKRAVLQYFFHFYHGSEQRNFYNSVKKAAIDISLYAQQQSIKTAHLNILIRKIKSLHDEWFSLKKLRNRHTQTEIEKRETFVKYIDSEFDLERGKNFPAKKQSRKRKVDPNTCSDIILKKRVGIQIQ